MFYWMSKSKVSISWCAYTIESNITILTNGAKPAVVLLTTWAFIHTGARETSAGPLLSRLGRGPCRLIGKLSEVYFDAPGTLRVNKLSIKIDAGLPQFQQGACRGQCDSQESFLHMHVKYRSSTEVSWGWAMRSQELGAKIIKAIALKMMLTYIKTVARTFN